MTKVSEERSNTRRFVLTKAAGYNKSVSLIIRLAKKYAAGAQSPYLTADQLRYHGKIVPDSAVEFAETKLPIVRDLLRSIDKRKGLCGRLCPTFPSSTSVGWPTYRRQGALMDLQRALETIASRGESVQL